MKGQLRHIHSHLNLAQMLANQAHIPMQLYKDSKGLSISIKVCLAIKAQVWKNPSSILAKTDKEKKIRVLSVFESLKTGITVLPQSCQEAEIRSVK